VIFLYIFLFHRQPRQLSLLVGWRKQNVGTKIK